MHAPKASFWLRNVPDINVSNTFSVCDVRGSRLLPVEWSLSSITCGQATRQEICLVTEAALDYHQQLTFWQSLPGDCIDWYGLEIRKRLQNDPAVRQAK